MGTSKTSIQLLNMCTNWGICRLLFIQLHRLLVPSWSGCGYSPTMSTWLLLFRRFLSSTALPIRNLPGQRQTGILHCLWCRWENTFHLLSSTVCLFSSLKSCYLALCHFYLAEWTVITTAVEQFRKYVFIEVNFSRSCPTFQHSVSAK